MVLVWGINVCNKNRITEYLSSLIINCFEVNIYFSGVVKCSVWLVSTYVVCEKLSVMHKQVSGWTVNFCPNSPENPFLEFQTRKPPPAAPPNFGKLQIWDDQSLLRNTPLPISQNFRFEMTKVYSEIPPPILENFRFEMTKVYSEMPPHFRKLQIWDDQSLLRNNPPPFRKTSDLRWPKFTPKYPPFGKSGRSYVETNL